MKWVDIKDKEPNKNKKIILYGRYIINEGGLKPELTIVVGELCQDGKFIESHSCDYFHPYYWMEPEIPMLKEKCFCGCHKDKK